MLDTICASSGVFASSPAQYIEAHEAEYRELLNYREYTLRFCFSEFLRGGQTDLRSHIMRAAIDDIAPEAQLRLYAETGQAYFDEWKSAALRVSAQHEMEWIEKNQPAIYLLLQMLDREMVADDTLIDEEVFEINTNGAALEYQLTYTSPTIILWRKTAPSFLRPFRMAPEPEVSRIFLPEAINCLSEMLDVSATCLERPLKAAQWYVNLLKTNSLA